MAKKFQFSSRIYLFATTCLMLGFSAPAVATHAQTPQYWSVAEAASLMSRYPDPNSYPFQPWCYCQGHLLEGFIKLRTYTGDADKTYYNYLMKFANEHVDTNGNLSGFTGASMDDMMAGVVICWAYNQTKVTRFKTAAQKIRTAYNGYPRTSDGAFWHTKALTGQFWIDGVFMGEMFNLRFGTYIGDSDSCFNEASRQLKLAHKHFLKGTTNLLLHGWDESKAAAWANATTGQSPEVWGEGLGWYADVLADAVEAVPATNKNHDTLVTQMKELAAALKNYQDSTGCWWDIVDKANVGLNWLDVSGTSFFVYLLQKGIDLGALDKNVYGPVVKKGYDCLVTKKAVINGSGLVDLDYSCDGLGIQPNYDDYMNCAGTAVGVKSTKWKKNTKQSMPAFLWATGIYEKPGYTGTIGKSTAIDVMLNRSAETGPVKVYNLRGRYVGTFANTDAVRAVMFGAQKSGIYVVKSDGRSGKIAFVK